MLVLSRSAEQEILIGGGVRIRVLRVSGSTVKLGIEAPPETLIVRGELDGAASPVRAAAPRHGGRWSEPRGRGCPAAARS